jgi:hypothetical protein
MPPLMLDPRFFPQIEYNNNHTGDSLHLRKCNACLFALDEREYQASRHDMNHHKQETSKNVACTRDTLSREIVGTTRALSIGV